ncbi:DUF262 domain-containing protein [Parvimonas micra]
MYLIENDNNLIDNYEVDENLINYYENDENLFDDYENEEIVPIPKEKRHLRTQSYDKSVNDLVGMMRDGRIILTPEYQRNYVWDNKKASLLIESILLNIPIPVIYAAREPNECLSWNIVDGLQRLNALKRFYNNEFSLVGLEILSELNGKKYNTLNMRTKSYLDDANLRIVLLFEDSHPDIKYDIFMRLNTGSVKLKPQELRNCLYRGSFNESLKEMVRDPKILNIMNLKEPHKRMDDVELILRYIAISENFDKEKNLLSNYNGVMKSFLNDYMHNNQNMSKENIENIKKKVITTVKKVFNIFGRKAFRRIDENSSNSTRINLSLMDVIMISFEDYTEEELIKNKDKIISLYKNITTNDESFISLITTGTSSKNSIELRIKKWKDSFRGIMNE